AELHVHERSGLELETRIREHEPYFDGTSTGINLRQYGINTPGEFRTGIRIYRNCCPTSRPKTPDVILKNCRVHPDRREISDRVKSCLWLHVLVRQCIAFRDVARHRG